MSTGSARKKYKALDRFDIIGELGQGGCSRILHIRDPDSLQHYAMKVVVRRTADDQKYLEQAKREFEVAQRLDHPSLLKVYDIRVKRRWFREHEVRELLEYVNGETLEEMHNPSISILVVVFARVAEAMSYMHRCDIFHADLKPNNVLVSRSGQVKVIDFGLAWFRGDRRGRVQGTPGYLAPEQIRDRVVTEATDIFNLGATMYRMLTGRLASGGITDSSGTFMDSRAVITPVHELRPDVPLDLSELVGRCCENNPRKRPQSMAEVADALTKIQEKLNLLPEDLPELLRQRRRGGEGDR